MWEFAGAMPIYEYECTSCSNVFEAFQRMTESPLTVCPDCAGAVKKLVSRSSFQLKGGGWYSDGYSSKSSEGPGSKATDTAAPAVKGATAVAENSTGKSSNPSTEKADKETCTATS